MIVNSESVGEAIMLIQIPLNSVSMHLGKRIEELP